MAHLFRETEINDALGVLGSSADAGDRAAVARAVWPTSAASHCGEVAHTESWSHGADWRLVCRPCGHMLEHAEHKPRGANCQWSTCRERAWWDAATAHATPPWWLPGVPRACWLGPHAREACDDAHPWKRIRDGSGHIVVVIPQTMLYAAQQGRPITLVTARRCTDPITGERRPSTADEIYRVAPHGASHAPGQVTIRAPHLVANILAGHGWSAPMRETARAFLKMLRVRSEEWSVARLSAQAQKMANS